MQERSENERATTANTVAFVRLKERKRIRTFPIKLTF